ncbi:hypothetical protein F2P81_025453 [Scophthalmus maximus]|uniref:Uncharacterized protein n=1 Tax=Scophthalmus maximus TaxID=52904 RepID=A0A6A4RQ52_SCOMX|nr:hypothetical protein F2P81_025453 [Scophthalmus maximus]
MKRLREVNLRLMRLRYRLFRRHQSSSVKVIGVGTWTVTMTQRQSSSVSTQRTEVWMVDVEEGPFFLAAQPRLITEMNSRKRDESEVTICENQNRRRRRTVTGQLPRSHTSSITSLLRTTEGRIHSERTPREGGVARSPRREEEEEEDEEEEEEEDEKHRVDSNFGCSCIKSSCGSAAFPAADGRLPWRCGGLTASSQFGHENELEHLNLTTEMRLHKRRESLSRPPSRRLLFLVSSPTSSPRTWFLFHGLPPDADGPGDSYVSESDLHEGAADTPAVRVPGKSNSTPKSETWPYRPISSPDPEYILD